jgi:hypothetical protein
MERAIAERIKRFMVDTPWLSMPKEYRPAHELKLNTRITFV